MKLLFPILMLLFLMNNAVAGENDSIVHVVEQYLEKVDPALPPVAVLIEENLTDPSVCLGPNQTYYLTGTSGDKTGVQQGIKVWASKDLLNWNSIGTNGLVWNFEKEGADWQKEISTRNGWKQRGMIAPKIYYFQHTFWISYTNSNSNKSGILKSTSGWAQGPYIDLGGDAPLIDAVAPSLFQDSDSSIYVLWGKGNIQKLDALVNGNSTVGIRQLSNSSGNGLPDRVTQLLKINGKYIVYMAGYSSVFGLKTDRAGELTNRYDGKIGVADQLTGPYLIEPALFPHVGNGSIFQSFEGNYAVAFTGNDPGSPVPETPCILPLNVSPNGQIELGKQTGLAPNSSNTILYVSPVGNNSTGGSWDNAYSTIQRAIDNAPDNCQIWIAEGRYEGPVRMSLRTGLYLYGGFKGTEKRLEERDTEKHKVTITGRNVAKHVMAIWSCKYIRVDGLTIQEGKADGTSFNFQYGGGIHVLGGGETIRIVNCRFENNSANQDGGALYASVGAAPVVINCTFTKNVARNNGGAVAVYCNGLDGYHVKFVNCTFDNNFAQSQGGAVYFDTNQRKFGLLTMLNCLLVNNEAHDDGGILTLDRNSSLMLYNSTFSGNKGTAQGAAIAALGKVPAHSRIVNCIFSANEGGTLFSIEGEAELVKVGDRQMVKNKWVEISNSLFGNNAVNALVQRNYDSKQWKTVEALNESVMGSYCKVGSPSFIDALSGDYRLQNSSNALGTGTTDSGVLPFTIEGLERNISGKVNMGCY